MSKAMKYIGITMAAVLVASAVYAADGAIAAWRRSSTGVLTSGVDSSGNIVAPTVTATTATIADVATGVQTESATNTATITVANKLINVTGGAGASILVTLASPTSTQLGEFVRLRNAGTNTLNVICNAGTTNAIAVAKETLFQAIDVNSIGWDVVYTTP